MGKHTCCCCLCVSICLPRIPTQIQIPEHTQHEDDNTDITAFTTTSTSDTNDPEAYVAADLAHALRPWLQDCIHAQPLPASTNDALDDDNTPAEQTLLLEPLLGSVRYATAAAFAGPQPFCQSSLSMQTRILQHAVALAISSHVFGEDLGDAAVAVGLHEFRTAFQLQGSAHCSTIEDAVEQAVAQAAAAAGGGLC